jgi:hypothetical protein
MIRFSNRRVRVLCQTAVLVSLSAAGAACHAQQSQSLRSVQIDIVNEDLRVDFSLNQIKSGGSVTGYTFHGTGTTIPASPMSVDLTWEFAAGSNLTTTFLGGGLWRMEAVSGKEWMIRQENACATPGHSCYSVIDTDSREIVLEMTTSDTWPIETAVTPTLAQVAYFLVAAADPQPQPPPCNPTFAQCVTTATAACGAFHAQVIWSCNPATGQVSCAWTCVNPAP